MARKPKTGKKAATADLRWSVSGAFAEDTRRNLSGAAFAPPGRGGRVGIVVNDQHNWVQIAVADGRCLTPGFLIPLPGAEDEIDVEGAAYEPASGRFYVTGSHGRRRHGKGRNPSSYLVHRFRLDRTRPLVAEMDVSDRLRSEMSAMKKAAKKGTLAAFFDEPLKDQGANVEGIAVKDGRVWLGFRAPVLGAMRDRAFLMSADAEALFARGPLRTRIHEVRLGRDMGIRDLVAVEDGFLVLSGPPTGQGDFAIQFWDGSAETARELRRFGKATLPKRGKPEAIAVLDDAPDGYRLLMLLENEKDGKPREIVVSR